MRLTAGCQLNFEAQAPAPLILMLRPQSGASQRILADQWQIEPELPTIEYVDLYGNACDRLLIPPGKFQITSKVTADTADTIDVNSNAAFMPVQFLPDTVLHFLLPSRYCQSDLLGELAREIVADIASGYDQVEAIRRWIHEHIDYQYDTSDASTSAIDTAQTRQGVCRDFVHLGMALCRSLTIPARMVVGYLYQLDPMDLHAWFEAFVGDRWYTFDATQSEPRGNRISIAYGRDAADVALANQFGLLTLTDLQAWVRQGNP
ncbi:MAG: transglutaminase family protein [Cyanobacteria bacterium P01_C01_bin.120]